MGGIFISYRRNDSGPYAGRLRDSLSSHFGADQIFRDIDRINPGDRFPVVIEDAVGSCDALLAVIGPTWLSVVGDDGVRRLDNPKDYVRQEIAVALRRDDVLVIPVLIESARIPSAAELPGALAALADHNAVRISDEGWGDQVARLIRALETVVARPPAAAHEPVPRPHGAEPSGRQQATPYPHLEPARPRTTPSARTAAALIALVVVAALGFAVFRAVSGPSSGDPPSGPDDLGAILETFGPGNVSVALSRTSGSPGTMLTVTGTGYLKGETVDIDFHATEVGTTVAGPDGSISVDIRIPDTPFRNTQFDVSATGKRSLRSDSAPFMVK